MLGHPDAAYDLPLETQTRLLGWAVARADLQKPAPKKPGATVGQQMLDAMRGG